ncbi:MAG: tetratricopeptide repeat protein [PVC group bacterium]
MKRTTVLLITALILFAGWGGFWATVYRAPMRSFHTYWLFLPGTFDLKEAAYRLGLKSIQEGEESQYLKRVGENPGDAEAHFILGYISYRRGNLPAAIASYQRALEMGFAAPKIHYWLARARADAGDLRAAGEEYAKLKTVRHPLEAKLARQLGLN